MLEAETYLATRVGDDILIPVSMPGKKGEPRYPLRTGAGVSPGCRARWRRRIWRRVGWWRREGEEGCIPVAIKLYRERELTGRAAETLWHAVAGRPRPS